MKNLPLRLHQLGATHSLAAICTCLLAGCASLLPSGEAVMPTPFASFDEARRAIESLQPFNSTRQTLSAIGLSPEKQANIAILTPTDILHRFVAGSAIERKDLDPGILTCLEAREKCIGWDINIAKISKQRTGNVLLDLLNYRRRTETTGWRFNAVVLINNDMVVYRAWGGQPQVSEVESTHNPLGPFQGLDVSSVIR